MLIKHCDRGNWLYETGNQGKDISWRNKFGSPQWVDVKICSTCFADKCLEHCLNYFSVWAHVLNNFYKVLEFLWNDRTRLTSVTESVLGTPMDNDKARL